MTVGSIVLIGQGEANAAVRSLLGAPVAIRALAATLVPGEDVHAVVVAPTALHARIREEAERFGFAELKKVVDAAGDVRRDVLAGLEALGSEVDHVVVQHGLQALTPTALIVKL